jgi:hypothetical protein
VDTSGVTPVQKVKGGYRWGKTGKVYKTKAAAEKQGRAIHAAGYSKGGDTINAAGNYTKPTMRRNLLRRSKQVVKVESLVSGQPVKRRWLPNNTKLKVEAIHHNESTTEKLKEVD